MIWKAIGGENAFYGFLALAGWCCAWVWLAYEAGKTNKHTHRKLVYCFIGSFLLFLLMLNGVVKLFGG